MLTALPSSRWDKETAAHLLNRATFGATPELVDETHAKGLERAVRDLLTAPETAVEGPAPEWAHPRNLRTIRREARMAKESGDHSKVKAQRQMEGDELLDLRSWWLGRMNESTAPALEKLTLFWHGHFATSAEKVKDGYWMWRQNDTLRRGALGNFNLLTKAISRDPAMMIYLDLQQSRKEHPNENWARELMELFTVGIGNYSEPDVREAARAFTGYRVDPSTQQTRIAFRQIDPGAKNFLGHTGNFTGDQIIDLLTKEPACAVFIGKKICRYFIADEPTPLLVNLVSERLRTHNFEIKPVLAEIFSSAQFYDAAVRRSQIKSPTQFLLHTCKILATDLPTPRVAQNAMRQMGQTLFGPPNVKGWDGGKSWISTATLLFRNNFANYLINGDAMRPDAPRGRGGDLGLRRGGKGTDDPRREPIDVSKIASAELRRNPDVLLQELTRRVFQAGLNDSDTAPFRDFLAHRKGDTSDTTVRGLLHLMMSSPLYQLT